MNRRPPLVSNTFGTNVVSTFAYAYDELSRRTQRLDTTDSALTTNTFSYNVRSELIGATMGTNTYSYTYDPIGNRQLASANEVTNLYQANELNQYTNINQSPLVYDLDGNLVQDGQAAYAYDAENRLTSVHPLLPAEGSLAVANTYDHQYRRIRKEVEHYTNDSWTTDSIHDFVWNGNNIIQEKTTATQDPTQIVYYIWGLDKSGTEQGAGGVGGLLTVRVDGVTYFPYYDDNGNITSYVNEAGIPSAQYVYDAYGNVSHSSGLLTNALSFGFSTKYYDREANLIAYQRRFYLPTHGRWLTRDSIKEDGGINIYSICWNETINIYDALGLRGSSSSQRQCCYCGPEIETGLVETLRDVERRYLLIKRSNPQFADSICSASFLARVWDISFPSPPPGCGDGYPCEETYMVRGNCYNKWEINYVLFGEISTLCSFHRLKMSGMIAAHKILIKPLIQITGEERLEWEYTSQVRGWANIGRSFSGTLPEKLPKIKGKHNTCEKCPIIGSSVYSSKFSTTWPPVDPPEKDFRRQRRNRRRGRDSVGRFE